MQQPTQAAVSVPQKPKQKGKRSAIIAVIIALVVIIGIVVAGFLTNWFGLAQVSVKSSANDYSWDELSRISSQISDASDEYEAISVAKKYHLVNNDGKLDGSQTKDITLSDGTVAKSKSPASIMTKKRMVAERPGLRSSSRMALQTKR